MSGIVAHLMNCRNARTNEFTISQLNLSPSDRVLEIGFGNGVNLPHLMGQSAFVAGVDPSQNIVARAKKRYLHEVLAGRASFGEGRAEALPFGPSSFEKACAVNSIYFWDSLEKGFAEIRRVLVPGGQLAIGFLPRQWMIRLGAPSETFKLRTTDEVMIALTRAGFASARVERPRPGAPWNVILAARAAKKPDCRCKLVESRSELTAAWAPDSHRDVTTEDFELTI